MSKKPWPPRLAAQPWTNATSAFANTIRATRREPIGLAMTRTEGEIITIRNERERPSTTDPDINYVAWREGRAT